MYCCLGTHEKDKTNGHVGGPLTFNRVKLESVPELDYTNLTKVDDVIRPSGELLIKGPNVFCGYFRDLKNTAAAFNCLEEFGKTKKLTKEWLHTGDILQLQANGALKVVSRKKEIFKLSQGEYIVPYKLEEAYSQSKYVNQIVIHGNGHQSCIIAIVVPHRREVLDFLKKEKISDEATSIGDVDKYFEEEKLHETIIAEFNAICKVKGFTGLEKVKALVLSKEEFSSEGNFLLTPTQKPIRSKIEKFFEKEIKVAYSKIPQS